MAITLTKPTVGGSDGTWGTTLNSTLDSIANYLDGDSEITPDLTSGSWSISGTTVTASAAQINLLTSLTATATQLNYTDDVTSNIQAQLDGKAAVDSPTFTTKIVTPKVEFANWTITETSGVLYFATGGTNKMKLDASGNLTVVGDITAYGTI
ncbi:MAG: hypothetical protein ACPF8W_00040 [Luminiphilus sp.]